MTDSSDHPLECHGNDSRLAVENLRKKRAFELNRRAASREELQAHYCQVWTPAELAHDFEVVGFAAPYVVVRRKQDQIMGSLEYQHHPRLYFNFQADRPA